MSAMLKAPARYSRLETAAPTHGEKTRELAFRERDTGGVGLLASPLPQNTLLPEEAEPRL
jgi:hypothetical protein